MSAPIVTPAKPAEPPAGRPREVKIYAHSWLLYWWPVWVVGYLMAGWTLVDNRHMVLVPDTAVVQGNTLTLPEGTAPVVTGVHVAGSRVPGLVFTLTVLGVMVLGMGWAKGRRALALAALIAAALVAVNRLNWWDPLARWATYLHVYVNLGGYVVFSTGLLALWLFQYFVVDRRTYLTFTPDRVTVHLVLGGKAEEFAAAEVTVEPATHDWLRWVVGFGAGTIRVHTRRGWQEVPNVVHAGRRLRAILALGGTKAVTR